MKWFLLVVVLVTSEIHGQIESPCPSVFTYELVKGETDRWYGVVQLYTDYTLHGLWLNILLDRKAHILGNWDAEVSTKDNIDFKIENRDLKVDATPVKSLRLFTKYDILQGPPKVISIRLNGRELCDTDEPLPTPGQRATPPPPTAPPTTPSTTPSTTPPTTPPTTPSTTPFTTTTQSYYRPNPDLYYRRPVNKQKPKNTNYVTVILPEHALPSIIGYLGSGSPKSYPQPYPLSAFTNGNINLKGSYFEENNQDNQYFQCGKVYRSNADNPNPLVVKGTPTLAGQWPWQVALYITERLRNNYHCGGSLVSKMHVITAAHCVTQRGSNVPLEKFTLTVYLGKYNLNASEEGTQDRLVSEIYVHEDYDPNFFSKDVGILKLQEEVHLTQWVQPVCLWPEDQADFSYILGQSGTVVGWGYNENDELNRQLTLVKMPVVDEITCIRSKRKFFAIFTSETTYCAGNRNGESVCNGDSGGGMVFKMQDSWYLRGLVSLSVPREDKPSVCDPAHYIIFTDLAKFLPWIKDIINKDNYY